jgi:phage/conjugal plasmid C-4 type zinc finger TraR family protein
MGDIIDDANKIAAVHLNAALSHIKTQAANSVTVCIDCGDAIGAARKLAAPHAMRCVECADYHDKEAR